MRNELIFSSGLFRRMEWVMQRERRNARLQMSKTHDAPEIVEHGNCGTGAEWKPEAVCYHGVR